MKTLPLFVVISVSLVFGALYIFFTQKIGGAPSEFRVEQAAEIISTSTRVRAGDVPELIDVAQSITSSTAAVSYVPPVISTSTAGASIPTTIPSGADQGVSTLSTTTPSLSFADYEEAKIFLLSESDDIQAIKNEAASFARKCQTSTGTGVFTNTVSGPAPLRVHFCLQPLQDSDLDELASTLEQIPKSDKVDSYAFETNDSRWYVVGRTGLPERGTKSCLLRTDGLCEPKVYTFVYQNPGTYSTNLRNMFEIDSGLKIERNIYALQFTKYVQTITVTPSAQSPIRKNECYFNKSFFPGNTVMVWDKSTKQLIIYTNDMPLLYKFAPGFVCNAGVWNEIDRGDYG